MALPTGLIPVYAFVLTIGVGFSVTFGAHLLARSRPFEAALRQAIQLVAGLYLVGVAVVWAVAGTAVWEVALLLVVSGGIALVGLVVIPLAVGRSVIRRSSGADSASSLRAATVGWLTTLIAVFGIYVGLGGLGGGAVVHLPGREVCVIGFCGVAVWTVGAAVVLAGIMLVGPGLFGLAYRRRLEAAGAA